MRHLLRIATIGGLLSFAAVSSAIFLTTVRHFGPANSPDPMMTANHFLAVLKVDQPALQIERAMNRVQPDARLLLIEPESEPFHTQLYLTLSYFAYPRRLSAVICSGPGQGTILGPLEPVTIDGALFFETKVDDAGAAVASIGKMIVTRHKSESPWLSFCR
jgi:hypothetical protein